MANGRFKGIVGDVVVNGIEGVEDKLIKLDGTSVRLLFGLVLGVLGEFCDGPRDGSIVGSLLSALNMKMQLRVILTGKSVGFELGDVDGCGVGVDVGGSVWRNDEIYRFLLINFNSCGKVWYLQEILSDD
eukprot:scaffold25913_cov23-Cyclotella_meneghiniana.AAC.1